MNIELVPCHKDREFFICLAQEYIADLQKYDESIVWDESVWDRGIWDAMFIVDGGVLCGFIMASVIRYKGKCDLLFIDEFFVSENERRRKVGTEAVRALMTEWGGDVGFYILDKNERAKAFWNFVARELDWVPIERPDIRKEPGCELRVYRAEK